MYSPTLGRFMQTDPIGYDDQVNLYAYVANDPINGTDPTGEECDKGEDDGGCPDEQPEEEKEEDENVIVVTGKRAAQAYVRYSGTIWRTTGRAVSAPYNYGLGPALFGLPKVTIIPEKAYRVWREVKKTGRAPAGYKGGRKFQNREGRLPAGGDYREYDVDPQPSQGSRNAERIVVDTKTGEAWYTGDHCDSFQKLWDW